MIEYSIDTAHSILYVRPTTTLDRDDFANLTKTVDSYVETAGDLAGMLVEIPGFPGWENVDAMAAHFRFVWDHHARIKKVAVVTDSVLGRAAELFASHFVSPEIKHFPAGGNEAARQWILAPTH
jgi:hypothetical protein